MNFLERLFKRTVYRDLLFGLTLIISLVAAGIGASYYWFSTRYLERELNNKCDYISNELNDVLRLPIWDLNDDLIRQIIQAYMESGYLVGATVKTDQRVIVNAPPPDEPHLIEKTNTISMKGFNVGTVELFFTDKSVRDIQTTMIYAMFIVVIAVIAALIVGTYFVMWVLLNKPLSQLIQGIRNIGRGNYDTPLPKVHQQDFNEIIDEVNLMASVISRREEELMRLNKDLETRIAKQEEAEKALAESEKKYRGIFENAVEGIFQSSIDGFFISINPTMAAILGYDSPEETIENLNNLGSRLYVTPEKRDELIDTLQVNNRVSGFECRFYRKDRSIIWVSLRLRAIRDESGELIQMEGFLEDVTKRKEAEQELAIYRGHLEELVKERTSELTEANTALEQSMAALQKTQDHLVQSKKMAALGGLVAGVAHEINTPVGIGVTAASFLERKTKETENLLKTGDLKKSNLEKYMSIAVESTSSILANLNRASELIQSFKKLAVDQTVEERSRFDLKDYLDNMMLSLRPKYKRTKHTVFVNCPDDLVVNSFPGAFMQIVTNLVINSLHHGFENIEEGSIRIDVTEEAEKIVITYSDTGAGMSLEQMEHLYDPFFTTKRGHGGTGLGMHIVYNLVTRTLGGDINCDSEPGKGTTFTIRIPKEKDI